MKKQRKNIHNIGIQQLLMYPMLLGFLFLVIGLLLYEILFQISWFRTLMVSIAFFCWGFSGIAIIIKKESPAPWFSKGFFAIIQGSLIVIATWTITILGIVSIINN